MSAIILLSILFTLHPILVVAYEWCTFAVAIHRFLYIMNNFRYFYLYICTYFAYQFFSCPFKTQMWVKQLLLVNLGHNIPSRCIHFMIIWFISLWRFFCFMTSHDRISSLLTLQAVCYLIGSTRLLCIPHKETSLVVSETRPFWNC